MTNDELIIYERRNDMSKLLYKYLKWLDELGSKEQVRQKFIQEEIPYELYSRSEQSVAEQGLISGAIETASGYFVNEDASVTGEGLRFMISHQALNDKWIN